MAKTPVPAADRTVAATDNMPLEEALKHKHKGIFDRLDAWLAKAKKAKLEPKTLAQVEALEALYIEGKDLANDADSIREAEKKEPFEICKKIDAVFNGGVRDEIGEKAGLASKIRQAVATRRLAITREEQRALAAESERLRKEAEKIAERASEVAGGGEVRVADVLAGQAENVHQQADALAGRAAAPVAEASKATSGKVGVSVDAPLVCTGIIRSELDLNALRPFLKESDLIAAVNAVLKTGEKTVKGAVITEQAKSRFTR